MRLTMFPATVSANDNPFISITVNALKAQGVRVIPFTAVSQVRSVDVLHVHWLEGVSWGLLPRIIPGLPAVRTNKLISLSKRLADAGKRVVWTVHNLEPHDFKSHAHEVLYERLMREFVPNVSDVICMSENVKATVSTRFPQLEQGSLHVVRHPHYREHFARVKPALPPEVEPFLAIRPEAPLLTSVGMVRRYKAIPETIEVVRQLRRPFRMVIAGKGDVLEETKIFAAIEGDSRFLFIPRRLQESEMIAVLAASTLGVYNFNSILNSGSVLAALSLGCPILAPEMGAIRDLRQDLGSRWVKTFEAKLTVEIVEAAVGQAGNGSLPDLSLYDPHYIAAQLTKIYAESVPPT